MKVPILGTIWVSCLSVAAWAVLHFWVRTTDICPDLTVAALIGMGSWARALDDKIRVF